jgi:hypothetical protein
VTLLLLFANPVGASASPISATGATAPRRPGGSAQIFQAPRTTGPYVVTQYSSFQGDGGNDGLAITTDARPQPGDQLLLTFCNASSIVAPTPPAGWYEIPVTDTDFTGPFQARHYLLANPAASTTYTWTGVISTRRTMIGLLIRGGVLESGEAHATSSVSAHVTPTLQAAGPDRLAIAACCLRGFPTDAWIENQTGNWDERLQVVGGDATTNAQVSMQNKPVPAGAVSDTFAVTTPEDVIIGLFLFGPGIPSRAPTVITAPPGPRPAGTATATGSRTDPTVAAQDFPPHTITTLATARPPVGSAQVLAPHTDITPDAPSPAPVLSTGRPAAIPPGVVVVAGPRTDPPVAGQPTPAVALSTGRGPQPLGSTLTVGSRTDPSNDPAQVGALVSTGRPPATPGSATVLASHADPITDPPTPAVTASIGRPPAYPGTVLLAGSRTDPVADPQPRPLVVGGTIRPPSGASLLLRTAVDPQPDSTPRLLVVPAGWRSRSGASSTTVQPGQPPVAGPGTPPAQLVVPAFVPRRIGSTNLAHVMHSCSIPRPTSGITSRPSTGITAYNPATTARPSTGTTARPNTGTTVDPC